MMVFLKRWSVTTAACVHRRVARRKTPNVGQMPLNVVATAPSESLRHVDHSTSPELLSAIHAYWRAANYLSVGQIYLYNNPLLKRALQQSDEKALVALEYHPRSEFHLGAS